MGSLAIPIAVTSILALNPKGSEMTESAGIPACSNVIPSWILHELHDPQSPKAVSATSLSRSAAKTSGSIGLLAVGLDWKMNSVSE